MTTKRTGRPINPMRPQLVLPIGPESKLALSEAARKLDMSTGDLASALLCSLGVSSSDYVTAYQQLDDEETR